LLNISERFFHVALEHRVVNVRSFAFPAIFSNPQPVEAVAITGTYYLCAIASQTSSTRLLNGSTVARGEKT
jgi:hypothetical protein